MTEVRLRRGPLCRLAGSNTQAVLSLLCLALLAGAGYGLAAGRAVFGDPLAWVPALVLFVPWIAGLTAWARADDRGVRWRYWLRHDLSWEQVTRVSLTRRDFVTGPSGFTSTRSIVVHGRTSSKRGPGTGFEDAVRPAESAGRHQREFAGELARLARGHGVRVVVASSGWDEPMPSGAEEQSWI